MPYRTENIVRKGEIACYNFSISHNVFHCYISLVCQNAALCGNGLTLLHDKIMNPTKFNALADDKYNIARIMILVFDRVKNIVGKGENAGYWHFLLFSQ